MPDDSVVLAIVITLAIVTIIIVVSLIVAALGYILYRRKKRKTRHQVSAIEAPPTPEVRYTAQSNNCRAILPQSKSKLTKVLFSVHCTLMNSSTSNIIL